MIRALPLQTSLNVHAEVRRSNGQTWVDFTPSLRFVPSDNSGEVGLAGDVHARLRWARRGSLAIQHLLGERRSAAATVDETPRIRACARTSTRGRDLTPPHQALQWLCVRVWQIGCDPGEECAVGAARRRTSTTLSASAEDDVADAPTVIGGRVRAIRHYRAPTRVDSFRM